MDYAKLTKRETEDYEIILKSGSFDYDYYYNKYKIDRKIHPITHFLKIGVYNGYNPSPTFDTKFYLKLNPDVKKAGINPYVHYIKYGKNEKRIPKGITYQEMIELKLPKKYIYDYLLILNYGNFDKQYYTQKYQINKNTNPIVHFLKEGVKKGHNPTPSFDTKFYLKQNPDVKKAGINPYVHYIKYGKNEKRIPRNTDFTRSTLAY